MCRYVEDLLPLTKIMAGAEMSSELRLDDEVDVRHLRVFYMEVCWHCAGAGLRPTEFLNVEPLLHFRMTADAPS